MQMQACTIVYKEHYCIQKAYEHTPLHMQALLACKADAACRVKVPAYAVEHHSPNRILIKSNYVYHQPASAYKCKCMLK